MQIKVKSNQSSGLNTKLINRQQQKFLLLLSRDDFQKDVSQLRAKWAIPNDGLQTPESHETWWSNHNDNADSYESTYQQANHLEILEAERRWQAKEITTQDLNTIKATVSRRNPVNALYYDIDQLIERYRLPPRWKEATQAYLFTNEPRYKGPVGIVIKSTFGRDGEPDEITLVLDGHTTRQDLIDAWPSIVFHRNKLKHKTKDKTQPFDQAKLERNKLAYQLKKQGKSYRQIADILSERYDLAYGHGDIPTMIKNYKKLLGMN